MNIIQHNLTAAAAATQQGINATNFQKSAKKLSSGYRVNSASDDAAGLSISEKMRAQIRGLKRSARNAEEGASFMQVGDGAMEEAHSILHRMSELTVQSLNDTNTPADRAALAAEFEQLQCELDRINNDTYYNTLPVFEQHAPSFYQIAGNRVWAATQTHSVLAPDNTLNIRLPGDLYDPADYVITVPSGIYTTQELIDEIDTAIMNLDPKPALKSSPDEPFVPGFVFEYTDFGYCNLNFESEDGLYTEISSVDGGLAYLLYGTYNSSNIPSSLLGTTAFVADNPITIVSGKNDTLTFYVQSAGGSSTSEPITLQVPAGEYLRNEMIDKLNELLDKERAKNPALEGVYADEYGPENIQITGGPTKSITGLKGNMFNIEQRSPIYNSVFYDNIDSGYSSSSPASFMGAAYYNPDYTKKIEINETNDTLRFRVSKDSEYTEIKLAHNKYTIQELSSELQSLLKANPDVTVSADRTYLSLTGTYTYYDRLKMSSTGVGTKYAFEFDKTDKYGKAFNALFEHTEFEYLSDPSSYAGADGRSAQLTGTAILTGQPIEITSGANELIVYVDDTPVPITIPAGTYANVNALLTAINDRLPADAKISFVPYGNFIAIKGSNPDDVKKIGLDTGSTAYQQLFTREGEGAKTVTANGYGNENYIQGTTLPDDLTMASVTLDTPIPADSTKIDSSNNQMTFYLNNRYVSITIPDGTYTRQQLIAAVNEQFNKQGLKVQASLTNNCLTLTTTPTGMSQALSIRINSRYSSAWKAFVGTETSLLEPSPNPAAASEGTNSYLQGAKGFNDGDTIEINDDNRKFTLSFDGTSYSIELPAGTYTVETLKNALQKAVDTEIGTDKINVTVTGSGCIRFEAVPTGPKNIAVSPQGDNTFYRTVLQRYNSSGQNYDYSEYSGRHSYDNAFIVGRSEIAGKITDILPGVNDTFTMDLSCPDPANSSRTKTETLNVKLPAGSYDNTSLINALNAGLAAELNRIGVHDIALTASIGPLKEEPNVPIEGVNKQNVLHIMVTEAVDSSGRKVESSPGSYLLDGIRGNASYTLFYKSVGTSQPIYLVGSKDVSKGVTFTPSNNELSVTVDGTPYTITYPQPASLTADELIEKTNELLEAQNIPIEASLENGRLKFTHKLYADKAEHTISDVSGSAAGTVFYASSSRDHLDAMMLQVGPLGYQGLGLPRFSIKSAALGINSITITKPKYANKALVRLNRALDLLSSKRSTYGALTNRIDHIVANNDNTAENVQAGESRIRDTDMAEEMINLIKHHILMQASESLLAQANQMPNTILRLLQ